MRGVLIVLFVILHWTTAISQATFYAHLNDEKVHKGSFFKIEYQLSDARGNQFKPPSFDHFAIKAGPARSYQSTIVNGKMNSFERYSYTLQTTEVGDFVIPPASIIVKGKLLQSNPLHITVLPSLTQADLLSGNSPTDKEYFIVAELNRDTAYIGQQVILDYRIFTNRNIDRVNFKKLPELKHFHWHDLPLLGEVADQVEIAGITYTTKLIKRYALFPKRGGVFDLDPAQVLLMIAKPKRRGFFFDNYESKYVHSNLLNLTVQSLPTDAPESFSGLVGTYTMESYVKKRHLSTDDALTLQMKIKGNGDGNRISLKPIECSPALEVYEPKIIQSNQDQNQKKRDHYALIEYLYTANKEGQYFVQPTFTYFDVDSNAYVTLFKNRVNFKIKMGSGVYMPTSSDTSAFYSVVNGTSSPPNPFFISTLKGKLIWCLFFIGTLLLLILKWKKGIHEKNKPPISDKEQAIASLEKLTIVESDEIAHRIEAIVRAYFGKQLEIDAAEFSDVLFEERMRSAGYDKQVIEGVLSLFNQCKYVAYAGSNTKQEKTWIEMAVKLIQSN